MSNLEFTGLNTQKLMHNIEAFEQFCMGKNIITPAQFREINEELSIGAVFMIGKHRYVRNGGSKHLIWKGLDGEEHDLGALHQTNIMRDFPGFHARRSMALAGDLVQDSKVFKIEGVRSSMTCVVLKDGTEGIGPNYRMALRNAALKAHLKSRFNMASLSSLWNSLFGWGNA